MKSREKIMLEHINLLIQAWVETGYENYRAEAMCY